MLTIVGLALLAGGAVKIFDTLPERQLAQQALESYRVVYGPQPVEIPARRKFPYAYAQ